MVTEEKPVGRSIGWQLVATSNPFSTPWLKLRQDQIQINGRGETTYTYIENPGSVVIVPVTSTGDIILIRQYRYPVDAWCFEVPAGGLAHSDSGVSSDESARAELMEEIGAVCSDIQLIASYYPINALSNEVCYVYLAVDTEVQNSQRLETTEFIEIFPTPAKDAIALARTGKIEDGFSALAILMCEPQLRSLGFVS